MRTAKQIGDREAKGEFYIVKVKVFSDAKNPNIAFRLLEPKAEIADVQGHIYMRNKAIENLLPTSQIQLNQDIKGTETLEKEIVYDITGPSDQLKLLVTEGYGVDKYIEAVLIDDEDSILHKQTYFKLPEQNVTASRNRER